MKTSPIRGHFRASFSHVLGSVPAGQACGLQRSLRTSYQAQTSPGYVTASGSLCSMRGSTGSHCPRRAGSSCMAASLARVRQTLDLPDGPRVASPRVTGMRGDTSTQWFKCRFLRQGAAPQPVAPHPRATGASRAPRHRSRRRFARLRKLSAHRFARWNGIV